MTDVVWQVSSDILRYMVLIVYAMGWMIVLLSTFMINHFELFDLQQVHANLKNKAATLLKF